MNSTYEVTGRSIQSSLSQLEPANTNDLLTEFGLDNHSRFSWMAARAERESLDIERLVDRRARRQDVSGRLGLNWGRR